MLCPYCRRKGQLSMIWKEKDYSAHDDDAVTYKCVNNKCPHYRCLYGMTFNGNVKVDIDQERNIGDLFHQRRIARKRARQPFVLPSKPSKSANSTWSHKGTKVF